MLMSCVHIPAGSLESQVWQLLQVIQSSSNQLVANPTVVAGFDGSHPAKV
jgi:hypothetical protein